VLLGPDVTRHRGYRMALTEAAIVANAALGAYTVRQELGAATAHGVRAAYGVFLLSAQRIWAPRSGDDSCAGLAYAAADLAAFAEFADAVVRSERIASLLERGSE
jgi:carbonic anhydrase